MYRVLLRWCVVTKNLRRAVSLHRDLMQRDDLDLTATAAHFALLIDCCCACGQLDSAMQVTAVITRDFVTSGFRPSRGDEGYRSSHSSAVWE